MTLSFIELGDHDHLFYYLTIEKQVMHQSIKILVVGCLKWLGIGLALGTYLVHTQPKLGLNILESHLHWIYLASRWCTPQFFKFTCLFLKYCYFIKSLFDYKDHKICPVYKALLNIIGWKGAISNIINYYKLASHYLVWYCRKKVTKNSTIPHILINCL